MNLAHTLDAIDIEYGAPMSVFSDMLRAMICAAPGNVLISADYSNIEGRVLAWLAGEQWKVDAFRAVDESLIVDEHGNAIPNAKGEKQYALPDIYMVTAGEILSKPAKSVTKGERQSRGKVPELALGFGGGLKAFLAMGRLYNTTYTDEEAEAIKVQWRAKHPKIKAFWYQLEDAAIDAVRNPGTVYKAGRILFRMAGSFLWCRLPSGRSLCYPYPWIEDHFVPWKNRDGSQASKPALHFKGVDPYTKQWCGQQTYGGSLAENVTQAVARDVLANGIRNVEAAGYPVVMHVHDELVAEVPEGFGSVADFESLMSAPASWMTGLPVVAEGWAGTRYRK